MKLYWDDGERKSVMQHDIKSVYSLKLVDQNRAVSLLFKSECLWEVRRDVGGDHETGSWYFLL